MRTIVTTRHKSGELQKFSFETSPLLNQEEQIKDILKKHHIEDEVISWQYFNAHEININPIFQVQNKSGNPAGREGNDEAIFLDKEKAEDHINFLTETCGLENEFKIVEL